MKFDVVMPTLNSASRLGNNIFKEVLLKIHEEIPVNRLIVVDDCSEDNTRKILEQFDALVIDGSGSLGKAREIGIKNVETKWFYFIDDDNILTPNFHEKMLKYVDNKTGMIFPRSVIPYRNYFTIYEETIWRFKKLFRLNAVAEKRGYTGATLIRLKSVNGIKIPAVARQEDFYIKSHIEHGCWKVKYIPKIIVWHFHRDLPSYKTQYLEGFSMAKLNVISHRRMLVAWLLTYPKSLLSLPFVRDFRILKEIPKIYYFKYKGFKKGLS